MAKGLKKIKDAIEAYYNKYWKGDMDALLLSGAKDKDVKAVKKALAGKAGVNARDVNGQTALMLAAAVGSTEIVKLLLEKGADLEHIDRGGESALIKAASGSFNLETVKVLLEKGADVNVKDGNGVTALMKAAMNACSRDMIRLLLEKGAAIGAKDKAGNTILMLTAIYYSKAEVFEALLANGADINAVNQNGETVLFIAVRNRLPAVLKALIEKGMDVNGKNSRGETPLSVAKKLMETKPQWKVIKDILEKAGAREQEAPTEEN